VDATFSQLAMLGSSLVLIFGLILLWRRRVPAYINAFTGQSVALAGVAGATGYFGNEPELYWVAAFLLVLKGAVIPALLRRMGRRDLPVEPKAIHRLNESDRALTIPSKRQGFANG